MIRKCFLAIISLVLMLFVGSCSKGSYTKERWVYNDVVSIDVNENIDKTMLQLYLQEKGAENINELESILLNEAKTENFFNDFYLFFDGKYAYCYDEIMDREATYVYKEIDGKVILAYSEYLFEGENVEENLAPEICPRFVVSEDGKELTFTYYHIFYYVSIKCVIE